MEMLCCESESTLFGLPKEDTNRNQWLSCIYNTVPEQFNLNIRVCAAQSMEDFFLNLDATNASFIWVLYFLCHHAGTLHHNMVRDVTFPSHAWGIRPITMRWIAVQSEHASLLRTMRPLSQWNTSCALAVLRTYNGHRVRMSVKSTRP